MTRRILLVAGLLVMLVVGNCFAEKKALQLKSMKDRLSYSMGLEVGREFKRQGLDISPEMLARGVQDILDGEKPLLTEAQVKDTINTYKQQQQDKLKEQMRIHAEKNLQEGTTFLSSNSKKPGVITLPSGLQYKVVKKGSGRTPTANDTVTVHYRGTLIDGTEFDSSYARNNPATFPVNGVIKGWIEALQLMKEGDKWQLFIPGSLAYGQRGAGRLIGPNATLLFDVELIKIETK